MQRHVLLAILLIIPTAALSVSTASQDLSSAALLVGQVVDAATGRPLTGALVTLTGPPPADGRPRPRLMTGADGRFVFRDLQRGADTITVARNGYVDGAYGRTRPGGPSVPLTVTDGQRLGDVAIRLWRHAAITGTVVDESGEPQIGVQVRALQRGVPPGQRRFVPVASASTDDRGLYRLGGLTPGDYLVVSVMRYASVSRSEFAAALSPALDRLSVSEAMSPLVIGEAVLAIGRGSVVPPRSASGLLIYPPVYHPAAPLVEGATVIRLEPGLEHEGADLQIAPVSTVALSGSVIGPDGPVRGLTLRLLRAGQRDGSAEMDWLNARTNPSGHFVFAAVPAGQYSLRAVQGQPRGEVRGDARPGLWVDLPVSVGLEDIANVMVVAQPGLIVRGHVEFDGVATRSTSLQGIQVVLEPADSGAPAPSRTIARPDGSGAFAFGGLPAGAYYIRVPNSPQGWMLDSVTRDGRDVADTPLIVTSDARGVVVRFTDRWSGIQGSVAADPAARRSALVVAFPTDSEAWGIGATRRTRSTQPAASGEFSFTLPAGDYFVIAVPADEAGDPQDPDFLERASRQASQVRVRSGERTRVDVRMRTAR